MYSQATSKTTTNNSPTSKLRSRVFISRVVLPLQQPQRTQITSADSQSWTVAYNLTNTSKMSSQPQFKCLNSRWSSSRVNFATLIASIYNHTQLWAKCLINYRTSSRLKNVNLSKYSCRVANQTRLNQLILVSAHHKTWQQGKSSAISSNSRSR